MRIFCPRCKDTFESDQTAHVAAFDHEADCHRDVMGQGAIVYTDLSESTRLLANGASR